MIRISVPFHGSVPTNRTLSSTGPLSVQLKRSYRLHASIEAYFLGEKALRRRSYSKVNTSIFESRHFDLRRLKAETSHAPKSLEWTKLHTLIRTCIKINNI